MDNLLLKNKIHPQVAIKYTREVTLCSPHPHSTLFKWVQIISSSTFRRHSIKWSMLNRFIASSLPMHSPIWFSQWVKECPKISKWCKKAQIWSWWEAALAVSRRVPSWWFIKGILHTPSRITVLWTVDVSFKSEILHLILSAEVAIEEMGRSRAPQISPMSGENLLFHSSPQTVARQTRAHQLALMRKIPLPTEETEMAPMEALLFKLNSKILR